MTARRWCWPNCSRRCRATIEGKITTIPVRIIAEGDHVVVEARGRNTTRQGKPYNNTFIATCFGSKAAS